MWLHATWILTHWVYWSFPQDSKGSRKETQSRPVWWPEISQCSGPSALQSSQTVTGPGLPKHTHTRAHGGGCGVKRARELFFRKWQLAGEERWNDMQQSWKDPVLLHSGNFLSKKPHLNLRINMLPLGRYRIWSPQRSEPDIRHCWSERNCQALAGWKREEQGGNTLLEWRSYFVASKEKMRNIFQEQSN